MGRILKSAVIMLVAVSIATPATLAAAGPANESTKATPPVVLVADGTMNAAIARAAAEVAAEQGVTAPLAGRVGARNIRKQMGGGGKGPMIMGLVSAVVGAGLTLYMVKQMKKNSSTDDPQ